MRLHDNSDRLRPGLPLSVRNVEAYRTGPGATFDLAAWSGSGGIGYTLSVDNGALSSSRTELYWRQRALIADRLRASQHPDRYR